MKGKKKTAMERRRGTRSKQKAEGTFGKMECLCLECGISNYLELEGVATASTKPSEPRILATIFCEACRGPLFIRGGPGTSPAVRSAEFSDQKKFSR
jgi:hypothetical protein